MNSKRHGAGARIRTLAVALLGLGLALACAHSGRPSLHATQKGIASYYAMSLAGRPTASGEPYDPEAMTAAHRSLPFGSVVRVDRIDSVRGTRSSSIRVRINDRGPFVRGRIIDLSKAAARKLGMLEAGVVPVRVQIVALP